MENQTQGKPTAERAEVEARLLHVRNHAILIGFGLFVIATMIFGIPIGLMSVAFYYFQEKDCVKKELADIESRYDIID